MTRDQGVQRQVHVLPRRPLGAKAVAAMAPPCTSCGTIQLNGLGSRPSSSCRILPRVRAADCAWSGAGRSRSPPAQRPKAGRVSLAKQKEAPQVNGLSILESNAVGPATRLDYLKRIDSFKSFATVQRLLLAPIMMLETTLLEYFDKLYLDGHGATEGSKLLAAMSWGWPEFAAQRSQCVRLPRAIQGWSRLMPAATRLPLPWAVIHLWAVHMALGGRADMGLALVLAADAYMRPGEVLSLRVSSVLPPTSAGQGSLRCWTLTLFQFELGKPSKTHSFDDPVVLDSVDRPWLGPALARLAAGRDPADKLFRFEYNEWATHAKRAAEGCGIQVLNPVLYMMRHSGPSNDVAEMKRTLPQVKVRGRWACEHSVRRYEKHSQLNKMWNLLPRAVQQSALSAQTRVAQILGGEAVLPRPAP